MVAPVPNTKKKSRLRWQIAQYFELKWWQHYFNGKNLKDYRAWKKSYWEQLLDKLETPLPLDKNQTVLDAGCGPAGIFMVLDHCQVTAVDPLLDKYQQQLTFFQPQDYTHTQFVTKTLESFEVNRSFDVVFCMNTINHVANLHQSIEVLYNHLKEGGYLVLSVDGHNYTFCKHLFRLLPGDILHPHQYDLKEYRTLLKSQDLKLTETRLLKSTFLFNHYLLVLKK